MYQNDTRADSISFSSSDLIENAKVQIKKNYDLERYDFVAEQTKVYSEVNVNDFFFKEYHVKSNLKLKNYLSLIDFFSQPIMLKENDPFLLKVKAFALAKEGRYLEALTTLDVLKNDARFNLEWKSFYYFILHKTGNKDYKNAPSSTYEDLLISGRILLFQKNYSEAIKLFTASLLESPQSPLSLEFLADCFLYSKNYYEAISTYEQSSQYKNSPQHYIKKSYAFFQAGDLSNASKSLEKSNGSVTQELIDAMFEYTTSLNSDAETRDIKKKKINSLYDHFFKSIELQENDFFPNIFEAEKTNLDSSTDYQQTIHARKNFISDKKNTELYISPTMKSYTLTGNQLNANINFTTGVALGLTHTLMPENKNWNQGLSFQYSAVKFSKLNGLSPNNATFQNLESIIFFNHKLKSIFIGTYLSYEKLMASTTNPRIIREDGAFLNLGIQASYISIFKHLKYQLRFQYEQNFLNDNKSTFGEIKSRSNYIFSSKMYLNLQKGLDFVFGANYKVSKTRKTAQNSTEKEYLFPLGVSYEYE